MFFTSLIQDGPRGLQVDTANHTTPEPGRSAGHPASENPFLTGPPSSFQVDVEVLGCPLNGDQLEELDGWLRTQVDESIRCMSYRKSVWIDALDFCSRLCDDGGT